MPVSFEMKSYLFSTKTYSKKITDQAKVHFHHVGKVKGKFWDLMPAKVAGDRLMDVCLMWVSMLRRFLGDHTTLSHTTVSVIATDKVEAVKTILQEMGFYPF